jgi:hypothetical protein
MWGAAADLGLAHCGLVFDHSHAQQEPTMRQRSTAGRLGGKTAAATEGLARLSHRQLMRLRREIYVITHNRP